MAITVCVPVAGVVDALINEIGLLWDAVPDEVACRIMQVRPELVLPDLVRSARPFLDRLAAGETLQVGTTASAPFFRLIEALSSERFVPAVRLLAVTETWVSILGTLNRHLRAIGYLLNSVVVDGVGYFDAFDPDSVQLWPVWEQIRPRPVAREYARLMALRGPSGHFGFTESGEETSAVGTRFPGLRDRSRTRLFRFPDPRALASNLIDPQTARTRWWQRDDSRDARWTLSGLVMRGAILACAIGPSASPTGSSVPPERRRFPLASSSCASGRTKPVHRTWRKK